MILHIYLWGGCVWWLWCHQLSGDTRHGHWVSTKCHPGLLSTSLCSSVPGPHLPHPDFMAQTPVLCKLLSAVMHVPLVLSHSLRNLQYSLRWALVQWMTSVAICWPLLPRVFPLKGRSVSVLCVPRASSLVTENCNHLEECWFVCLSFKKTKLFSLKMMGWNEAW